VTSVTGTSPIIISGTSANPIVGVGTELTGLSGLASLGFIQRTSAGVYSTLQGTSNATINNVVLRDGAGISNFLGIGLAGSTTGTVSVQPPASVTSYSMTLPASQGAAGQVLSNNGSGVLSWVNMLTGSLNSGQILVGSSSNVGAGVTMSGDATLSNTGVLTIAAGAITTTKTLTTNPGINRLIATDSTTGSSLSK